MGNIFQQDKQVQMKGEKPFWFPALLVFLILSALAIFSISKISSDHNATVVHHAASVHAGYQTQPEVVDVTASPAFIWSHGGHSTGLIALGFALFFIAAVYVYESKHLIKGGSLWVLAFCAIAGFAAILAKYEVAAASVHFERRSVPIEQFNSVKDNPDVLFDNSLTSAGCEWVPSFPWTGSRVTLDQARTALNQSDPLPGSYFDLSYYSRDRK